MKIKGRLREGKSHQEADLKGFKQNRDMILCMEKRVEEWDFFIQKTGTIPIKGILRDLKKKKKSSPLSKNKNKQTNKNPAVQDHCLKQRLTICDQRKGRLQNMPPLWPALSCTSPAFLLAEATLSPQSKQVRAQTSPLKGRPAARCTRTEAFKVKTALDLATAFGARKENYYSRRWFDFPYSYLQ